MESEDLVSLCSVQSAPEAEMIRGALEAVDIPCQIGGEGQGGFAGVLAIDVLVHASDLSAARKYLRKLRREKLERKKQRAEAKKAKKAEGTSEAIQEMPPRKKPPES
jgi:hypothetical protein